MMGRAREKEGWRGRVCSLAGGLWRQRGERTLAGLRAQVRERRCAPVRRKRAACGLRERAVTGQAREEGTSGPRELGRPERRKGKGGGWAGLSLGWAEVLGWGKGKGRRPGWAARGKMKLGSAGLLGWIHFFFFFLYFLFLFLTQTQAK